MNGILYANVFNYEDTWLKMKFTYYSSKLHMTREQSEAAQKEEWELLRENDEKLISTQIKVYFD